MEENYQEGVEAGGGLESLPDFNVEDEFKPSPLIPAGNYHGVVTKVAFVPSQFAIVWSFCLHDNGGVMSDGETPIDGVYTFFRNWLPKPGDESVMTPSGKGTKRQWKINGLKEFETTMGIDMSTPAKIADALSNAEWVGIEADLTVEISEYQGKFSNQVNRIKRSTL